MEISWDWSLFYQPAGYYCLMLTFSLIGVRYIYDTRLVEDV